MVFVKTVKYCEADFGEHISDFASEMIAFRKETECDLVGKFNDLCIVVTKETTLEDIRDFYKQYM